MSTSILTLQRQAISALILTMTKVTGYNYDWETVNERNLALYTFPRAEVYPVRELNKDTLAGIGSNDYTNEGTWEIHIRWKLDTSSTNPIFDIMDSEDMMVDDLKMLFGKVENRSVSNTCDNFMYQGFDREIVAIDQFTPRKIITRWLSVYSQDRPTPTQFAGS